MGNEFSSPRFVRRKPYRELGELHLSDPSSNEADRAFGSLREAVQRLLRRSVTPCRLPIPEYRTTALWRRIARTPRLAKGLRSAIRTKPGVEEKL